MNALEAGYSPTVNYAPVRRRISKSEIADDVRAGFRDRDIMTRHGLTRSQLNVVMSAIQADGLLDTIHTCPSCGLRAMNPIEECPRCGVVIAKLGAVHVKREPFWRRFVGVIDNVWDAIDCGGYRLLMHLKGKWKSRL